MKENVRTLRIIHQLSIGLCVAVLMFAISPDLSDRYQRALKEITALRAYSLREYATDAYATLAQEEDKFSQQTVATLATSSHPRVERTFFCEWPGEKATVNEYLDFFKREKIIAFIAAGESDMVPLYTDAVRRYRREFKKNPDELLSVTFELPRSVPQLTLKDGLQLLIDLPIDVRDPRMDLNDQIDASDISFTIETNFEFRTISGDAVSTTYTQIVKSSQLTTYMLDPIPLLRLRGLSLEHIENVSNQIGPLPLAEGAQLLQTNIDAARTEVEFAGIKVDGGVAGSVGPLAILLLLGYLLLNLRHLSAILHPSDAALITFPWVGIFPDRLSKLFTVFSLVVLPGLSEYFLMRRIQHRAYTLQVDWSLLFLSIVFGASCCWEVFRLQKSIRDSIVEPVQDEDKQSSED